MNDVNWWLMALAFLLGLLLTFAFTVRRVKREVPVGVSRGAAVAATGAAAAPSPAAHEKPYGEGSIRLATGSAKAPQGYSVKGNEDSMLYHTTESPSYEVTIAELWFTDVESAERAGFARWDSGKSQRGKK